MAETAAHFVDHVFLPLPVRQWVLSVPKRAPYFLDREPGAVTAVLHIFLRGVEHARLCPGGFSLDVCVCIAGYDCAGLERLLHYPYFARLPFALELIEQVTEDRVVYWHPPDSSRHKVGLPYPLTRMNATAARLGPHGTPYRRARPSVKP